MATNSPRDPLLAGAPIGTPTSHPQLTKEPAKWACTSLNCSRRFTRRGAMKDHIAANHSGMKQFECSSCNQAFGRQRDKNRHERLHTNDKVYTCKGQVRGEFWGCGRTFAREDGLVAYLRSAQGASCIVTFDVDDLEPLGNFFLGAGTKRYECTTQHFGDCHRNRNFKSMGCKQSFESYGELARHWSSEDGTKCKLHIRAKEARYSAQVLREKYRDPQAALGRLVNSQINTPPPTRSLAPPATSSDIGPLLTSIHSEPHCNVDPHKWITISCLLSFPLGDLAKAMKDVNVEIFVNGERQLQSIDWAWHYFSRIPPDTLFIHLRLDNLILCPILKYVIDIRVSVERNGKPWSGKYTIGQFRGSHTYGGSNYDWVPYPG